MADKRTSLAMIGGCETGIEIMRAAELVSPTDSRNYRLCVDKAALMVATCRNCLGEPMTIDDPEASPCAVLEEPESALILPTVLRKEI